jgi:hypothetical protein
MHVGVPPLQYCVSVRRSPKRDVEDLKLGEKVDVRPTCLDHLHTATTAQHSTAQSPGQRG